MTITMTVIGSVGASLWKPEHRVEIIATGTLISFLAILMFRTRHHIAMRKKEEEWLKILNDVENRKVRGKAGRHLLKIVGCSDFMDGFADDLLKPHRYRSTEVELALDIINGACREELEGMIDVPEFKGKFFHIVRGYWMSTYELIIEEQKTNPERWKHIFPVYDKYTKLTGIKSDHYDVIKFLNDEAFLG
jgi:hypothetical protein